jgi:hypothetical protein
MQKFKTAGNLVYNLIQDGWEKGNPRMVNDFYFTINNKEQNKKEQEELAKFIAFMLNDEEIVSIAQQRLSAEANASTA